MRVVYHNRKQLPEAEADGAHYVSFDELLAHSDVLNLNLPLNVGRSGLVLLIAITDDHCLGANQTHYLNTRL